MNKRLIKAMAIYWFVLLLFYVGSYYVLVTGVVIDCMSLGGERHTYEHYDLEDERIAKMLFQPIHWIDRRLRPHLWQMEGDTGPGELSEVRLRKPVVW